MKLRVPAVLLLFGAALLSNCSDDKQSVSTTTGVATVSVAPSSGIPGNQIEIYGFDISPDEAGQYEVFIGSESAPFRIGTARIHATLEYIVRRVEKLELE